MVVAEAVLIRIGMLESSVFSLEWKDARQIASEALLKLIGERDEQILQQFIPSRA